MTLRPMIRPAPLLALLATALAAQDPIPTAYPERDILSPFRTPQEVYAPPDELFRLLRVMRGIAEAPGAPKSFDRDGREVIDDPRWRAARADMEKKGLDAGYLASILRMSKNADDRATALYAAFFCTNVDYVINLISHIPGEPERKARELAFPRAVEYLRAHLGKRFGDLDDESKKALTSGMPQPGSPMAKAQGIVRAPRDEDHLHELRLIPFFQLLDVADPLDQAQALWFLKEVFTIRADLALVWLEPSLPRIRQLLLGDDPRVREQAMGLYLAIGPKDLAPPAADAAPAALLQFAETASRALFPPIRNLNDAVVQLHPSPERDAIVAAGIAALESSALGDPAFGKTKDGQPYRGYRLLRVPDELKPLAIPAGSVVTAVNGAPVHDAASLLRTIREQLRALGHPRKLVVEFVLDDAPRAVEYRIV